MSPFMQELISFISIMLGVIILTAWVMWIMLRPSGDTKVKEFSQESARNGLTQCVMENNELKNKVTRLEREIRVLMNAGYGGVKGKDGEAKTNDEEERLKVKGERLKIKDAEALPEKSVAGESKASTLAVSEKPKEQSEARPEESPKETSGETLKVTPNVAPKVTPNVAPKVAPNVDPKVAPKVTPNVAPKEMPKPGAVQAAVRQTASEAASKRAVVHPASIEVKPVSASTPPDMPPAKPVQKAEDAVKAVPPDEEVTATSSAEAQRDVDEPEKQKIADYLANVERTAERHKKEVEALAARREGINYPNNNLKRIKGIGPHLEVMLKKSGITSFQQIAEFSEQDIKRVSDLIGSFPRRIKREAWVEQARKILGIG